MKKLSMLLAVGMLMASMSCGCCNCSRRGACADACTAPVYAAPCGSCGSCGSCSTCEQAAPCATCNQPGAVVPGPEAYAAPGG